MFVRKFEADTMEEALGNIKKELGPDAVILKTVTNKGIKGALKKKKFEITAAISERNLVKKTGVDQVLNNDQKEQFYKGTSSGIANMIDQYDQNKKIGSKNTQSQANNYGNLSLNKKVKSTKDSNKELNQNEETTSELDKFLSLGEKEQAIPNAYVESKNAQKKLERSGEIPAMSTIHKIEMDEENIKRIDELESKLFELVRHVEKIEQKEPVGILHLRTTLRELDISPQYIQQLTKKALFELNESEIQNPDSVFEYALREMLSAIHTEMPLFSTVTHNNAPVVTVCVSDNSCGQTSFLLKLASVKKDSVIISCNMGQAKDVNKLIGINKSSAQKMFNLEIIEARNIPEIVSECRKAIESGKCVFVDYRGETQEGNETKRFVEGLRRSFEHVEILLCLSSIHSEIYNKKVISKYRPVIDGMIVSHLDQCLNFGALFNISRETIDLPYKFFSTGEIVPDDIESAMAERIISGIFNLK